MDSIVSLLDSPVLADFGEWVRPGLLAAFGGAASYVYVMTTKNKPFRWSSFVANLFLAFFVGRAVSGFVPEDTRNLSGVVMMLGFAGYRVLGKVEERIVAMLDSRSLPGGTEP